MRAVIFVNGVVDDYARLAAWLRADDYLIGADGGTMHCLALGRRPDVVVGDLDSLSGGVVAELRAAGVEIEEHPVAKDKTDLDLAIDRAIRDGADAVLLVGALGGRLDQTLSNLLLLARREWPVPPLLGRRGRAGPSRAGRGDHHRGGSRGPRSAPCP